MLNHVKKKKKKKNKMKLVLQTRDSRMGCRQTVEHVAGTRILLKIIFIFKYIYSAGGQRTLLT